MATLNIDEVPVESRTLFVPSLEEIAKVLNEKLVNNFEEVQVKVVDCPDLTQQPFTLASRGLCGNPSLIEIGGVPYLLPSVNKKKLYDIKDVRKIVNLEKAFIVGAGAGPWPYANTNCEMMINVAVDGDKVDNHTRISKVSTEDGSCILERLPDTESRSALLSNLFCSEGKSGKVLEISCKKRTGKNDFVTSVRTSLKEHFGEKAVGLGGVFLLKEGKAKQHVMPDFSKEPLESEDDLNKWLKFFNMSAPLIAVGHLVTADPGLDLRVQHFHSFSHHGEGGHYHNDTTPETAEYLAYFGIGEKIYRVDKPEVTHTWGRD